MTLTLIDLLTIAYYWTFLTLVRQLSDENPRMTMQERAILWGTCIIWPAVVVFGWLLLAAAPLRRRGAGK